MPEGFRFWVCNSTRQSHRAGNDTIESHITVLYIPVLIRQPIKTKTGLLFISFKGKNYGIHLSLEIGGDLIFLKNNINNINKFHKKK